MLPLVIQQANCGQINVEICYNSRMISPIDDLGFNQHTEQLMDLVRIPSVSLEPERKADCRRAAGWILDWLKNHGARDCRIIEHSPHPLVYGCFGNPSPDAPSVLVYGHYDVVAGGPESDWSSKPFEPLIRDGFMYGRGSSDMKGPVLASLIAVQRAVESRGSSYPWNIKILIEGAEEGGSSSIKSFIETQPDQLAADFAFSADAGMYSYDRPSITLSVKALTAIRLTLTGSSRDQHSGLFGGALANPNHVLAEIISKLHDEQGRIAIEGIYDDVPTITAEQKSDLAEAGIDDEYFLKGAGVSRLAGEEGFSAAERVYHRPSLQVVYMNGGKAMNIIPSSAEAMLSMRLVPGQDPARAQELLAAQIKRLCPDSVALQIHKSGYYPGAWTDRNHFGVEKLYRALAGHWAQSPVRLPGGGGIPVIAYLQQKLNIPSVLTGIATVADNIHGADERIHLDSWRKSINAYADFFASLADE